MSKRSKKKKERKLTGEDIKINACMIIGAQTEASRRRLDKTIYRCLMSVRPFVDDIIIVDTGMTEYATEVARSVDAKIYREEWRNDFSFHRNQSLSYSDADWNLVIDSDGEMVYEMDKVKDIRDEIADLPQKFRAVAFPTEDIQKGKVKMRFSPSRMFRKGAVKYRRKGHNKPEYKGQTILLDSITFRHYGYDLTAEERKEKHSRIVHLMEQTLKEDPTDYECYFYLNQAHALYGEVEKSIEYGEKYIEHIDDLKRFNPTVFFTLARNYMSIGDTKKAGRTLKIGLEKDPEDLDMNLALCELGTKIQNLMLAEKGAEQYLMTYAKYRQGMPAHGKFVLSDTPEALAYCLHVLALVKFSYGIQNLQNLLKILPAVSERYAKEIISAVRENLELLGIGKLEELFDDNLGLQNKEEETKQCQQI